MADTVNITMLDNSNEATTFGVPVAPIVGANLGGLKTAVTQLRGLLEATGYLNIVGDSIVIRTKSIRVKPSDPDANRESGVRYHLADSDGNTSSVTQGGANFSMFPFVAAGKDIVTAPFVGLNSSVQLLVDWLGENTYHPISGLNMGVVAMEKVGRNL